MVTAWKADLGTKKVGHHCSNWKQYIGKNLSCWSRARIVVYWSVFTLPRSWGKNVRFPAEEHTFQINCGLAHRKCGWLLHCTNCRSMQPIAGFAVLRLHRLLQCWWNLAKCISSKWQVLPSNNFPFNRKQCAFAPKYFFPVLWKRHIHSNVPQQIKQYSDSIQFHQRLRQCAYSSYWKKYDSFFVFVWHASAVVLQHGQLTLQSDSTSCGVCVCYTMDEIESRSMHLRHAPFCVNDFRAWMAKKNMLTL